MLPRPVLGRRARAPDRSARPPPDHAPRAPAYLLQPVNVSVHRRWAIEKSIIIIVRPIIGLINRASFAYRRLFGGGLQGSGNVGFQVVPMCLTNFFITPPQSENSPQGERGSKAESYCTRCTVVR